MDYKFSQKLAELKPSAIREIFKNLTDPEIISFAAGNPAAESFPVSELARLSADIFASAPVSALQYSITEGYPPLREAVAKRQKECFGIGRSTAQGATFNDTTMIVSGGQQGIELACKVFCNEGDTVLCENPTFIGSLNSFRSNGAIPVGIDMESDGISPTALERAIREHPRTKLIYLIPTFQNPTGITTPTHKRREIYAIAQKYGIPILEDNPYGELRFAGEELPTLKSMDEDGLVIYCSSFSKILSAGMRLGFVVAPEQIISKMAVAKQGEDVHTNIFSQMLCHRFLTVCDLDGHIQGIRELYRRKCERMLTALKKEMPRGFTLTRPEGGLFLWGTLPEGVDLTAFVRAALERKVAVVPGTAFNCNTEAPSRSFRLNYSTPSDEQITEGVKRLGEAARAVTDKNT